MCNGPQASLGVENPMLVLQICEDCEKTGSVEWTHSQVFGLEGHSQLHPLVRK